MGFDKDYIKLLSFVRKYIKQSRLNIVDAGDILSESYLCFVELGVDYSFDLFFSICKKKVFESKGLFEIKNRGGVTGPVERYNGNDLKTCKICKEVKPIEMFRSIKRKDLNIIIKHSYCKKCQNKKTREREKKERAKLSDSAVVKIILNRKGNIWTKGFILDRPRLIDIERRILMKKRIRRKAK